MWIVSALAVLLILPGACTQKDPWTLVWSEDFDDQGSPDPATWDYELGYIRNRELQYYTDDPQNVRVENSRCILTARLVEGDSITSASIHTREKRDFLYGRVEVRARIPSALGSWPAIWLHGSSRGEVGWPACGEIDIMEHVGFDPDLVHATIHTEAYNHVLGTQKGNTIRVEDPWADFHVYALEWYEDHLDFFCDDSLYFTYDNDGAGDPSTWPFDRPHYLKINLAYGGSWGGQEGVDPALLPLHFDIDYVRYYRLKK
jgi:beta-glucanase (GH16 family)